MARALPTLSFPWNSPVLSPSRNWTTRSPNLKDAAQGDGEDAEAEAPPNNATSPSKGCAEMPSATAIPLSWYTGILKTWRCIRNRCGRENANIDCENPGFTPSRLCWPSIGELQLPATEVDLGDAGAGSEHWSKKWFKNAPSQPREASTLPPTTPHFCYKPISGPRKGKRTCCSCTDDHAKRAMYDMQCVYMKLWKDFKRAIFKLAGIAPHFGNEEQEDAMIDSLLKTDDQRGGGSADFALDDLLSESEHAEAAAGWDCG